MFTKNFATFELNDKLNINVSIVFECVFVYIFVVYLLCICCVFVSLVYLNTRYVYDRALYLFRFVYASDGNCGAV